MQCGALEHCNAFFCAVAAGCKVLSYVWDAGQVFSEEQPDLQGSHNLKDLRWCSGEHALWRVNKGSWAVVEPPGQTFPGLKQVWSAPMSSKDSAFRVGWEEDHCPSLWEHQGLVRALAYRISVDSTSIHMASVPGTPSAPVKELCGRWDFGYWSILLDLRCHPGTDSLHVGLSLLFCTTCLYYCCDPLLFFIQSDTTCASYYGMGK